MPFSRTPLDARYHSVSDDLGGPRSYSLGMTTASGMAALARLAYYERQQMLSAVTRLAMLQKQVEDAEEDSPEWEVRRHDWQVETNAFLESFLVHFRNLLEFLAPTTGTREETVTAADFLGWPHHKTLDAPSSHRESIHKRLAHISKKRLQVSEEEKSWPVGEMAMAMEQAWRGFIEKLTEMHPERVPWFAHAPEQKVGKQAGINFSDLQYVSAVTTASTQAIEISGPFSLGTPDWILGDPMYEHNED